MLHDGLGAMVAGAYGYSFVVEYGANIVRMHTVYHKPKNARLLSGRSDEPEAWYVTKAFCRLTEQLVLPCCDLSRANCRHVVQCRTQPDHLGDHRCAGFKFRR